MEISYFCYGVRKTRNISTPALFAIAWGGRLFGYAIFQLVANIILLSTGFALGKEGDNDMFPAIQTFFMGSCMLWAEYRGLCIYNKQNHCLSNGSFSHKTSTFRSICATKPQPFPFTGTAGIRIHNVTLCKLVFVKTTDYANHKQKWLILTDKLTNGSK